MLRAPPPTRNPAAVRDAPPRTGFAADPGSRWCYSRYSRTLELSHSRTAVPGRVRRRGAEPGCARGRQRYHCCQPRRATGRARHPPGSSALRARAAAVPALRARIPHARAIPQSWRGHRHRRPNHPPFATPPPAVWGRGRRALASRGWGPHRPRCNLRPSPGVSSAPSRVEARQRCASYDRASTRARTPCCPPVRTPHRPSRETPRRADRQPRPLVPGDLHAPRAERGGTRNGPPRVGARLTDRAQRPSLLAFPTRDPSVAPRRRSPARPPARSTPATQTSAARRSTRRAPVAAHTRTVPRAGPVSRRSAPSGARPHPTADGSPPPPPQETA
jgi:hypothetical protein